MNNWKSFFLKINYYLSVDMISKKTYLSLSEIVSWFIIMDSRWSLLESKIATGLTFFQPLTCRSLIFPLPFAFVFVHSFVFSLSWVLCQIMMFLLILLLHIQMKLSVNYRFVSVWMSREFTIWFSVYIHIICRDALPMCHVCIMF